MDVSEAYLENDVWHKHFLNSYEMISQLFVVIDDFIKL
jgi:hypothetical protein